VTCLKKCLNVQNPNDTRSYEHPPVRTEQFGAVLGEKTIETETIVCTVVQAAIDIKATEITIIDVRGKTSFTDWFVLCNGRNTRQLKAIAESVVSTCKADLDLVPLGVEGSGTDKWVLVDLGDVIVHVFHQNARGHFDIEGLWNDAPRVSPESLGITDVPPEALAFALP
jgi:ribosome-associated protein